MALSRATPNQHQYANARIPHGWTGDPYGILDRLLDHNRDQGGTLATISGIQGSGKTTFLLGLARTLAAARETVIWRGRTLAQWPAYPGRVRIWSDQPLELRKIPFATDDHDPEPEPLELPIHRFKGPQDLIQRAERGTLNVVYAQERRDTWNDAGTFVREPTRFWGSLVSAITRRESTAWISLLIDEIHEVWGDRPQGEDYHHQRDVRDGLADFRKSFASFYAATHHYDECDDAILKKFQMRLYLRGAKVPGYSVIRNKQLPHTLRPGEALIEGGNFAVIEYPPIVKPQYQVLARQVPESTGALIE